MVTLSQRAIRRAWVFQNPSSNEDPAFVESARNTLSQKGVVVEVKNFKEFPGSSQLHRANVDLIGFLPNKVNVNRILSLRANNQSLRALTVELAGAKQTPVLGQASVHLLEEHLKDGFLPDTADLQMRQVTLESAIRWEETIQGWADSAERPRVGWSPENVYNPDPLFLKESLRYGENPHQRAAFFVERMAPMGSIAAARQLQGRELSYNNIADSDAALECVKAFDKGPACVIVKHANPCGVAEAATLAAAYDRAYKTDPESAFGGIIAFNRELDGATAAAIVERQFVEVIVAPSATAEAEAACVAKKNVRLLVTGAWPATATPRLDYRKVAGGLLVQEADLALYDKLEVVTKRQPSEREMADLLFAWKVAKFVKSNAIVYARDLATVGVGAGQMSRVNSARIAVIKAEMAGLEVKGSVVASDAFFPFADGLIAAAEAGATAVIQPGGSMRDKEVIEAADARGLAMVMTRMRHFRH